MDNCKNIIADLPVNAAEFFAAITHSATELYISMHVLDLEDEIVFPIKTNEFIDKFMKSSSSLLSFADKALYVSKKKRNCVTLVPFEEKK